MSDLAFTLPLQGTQLIEASAGTGKTWTIAGLYLRAIVEQHVSVRDILVVTFTRAATEELKDRLRQRLADCADLAGQWLRGGAPGAEATGEAAFAQALLQRAAIAEPLPELARRLRLATESMDEATILTIHAWCQRVLREHAFDSGELLDAGELVGSDDDLLAQVAADFWRSHASDPACADAFELLRQHLGSPKALAGVLARLGDPDLAVWPKASGDASGTEDLLCEAAGRCRQAAARLLAAWQRSGEDDMAIVLSHALAGELHQQSYKPHQVQRRIERCRDCFGAGQLPERDTLEYLSLGKLHEKTKKGRAAPPTLGFPAAIDDWLAADESLRRARMRHWPALLATARGHVRKELARRKQAALRQSYDDLVGRVHAAVADPERGPQLAAMLHARHPLVLVDEFQDTDARQFAIFRSMQAAGGGGALILVGDPKQAIYRFRGGDIEAYLAAAAGAGVHRLERNFRSSPALLGAIEAVFGQAAPEAAFVDPRIRFHPVQAGGRAADDDVEVDGLPLVPLTAWYLPEEAGTTKEEGCSLLAAGCAEAILRLLRKGAAGEATVRGRDGRQPLAAHHVAVLVSTNREAGIMQDALAARGIASATIRQQSVFGTEEARDLCAFLEALESRNEPRLRAALATRLFGFDAPRMAELTDPAHAALWQAELDQLDGLHRVWQQHGVLALFERVFETQAADLLDSAGGERRLTNYLQLADLLQRAAAETSGAAGLVEWLRRRIALADDHNEEEQLRLESDADRVQIATVHASKGLEYDLVFLPFTALGPARHGQLPCVVEWHAGGLRQAWVRTTKDEEAPEDARDASEREELAERMRVLYVALTRARYGCWLSWDAIGRPTCVAALAQLWHGGDRQPSRAETRAALQRLATAAPGRVQVECLPVAGAERLAPAATAKLPAARPFRARIDGSWWISSFSQLRDGRRSALPDESGLDDEAAPDVAFAGADGYAGGGADAAVADWPRGERFGTAMHEILEHADFAAWKGHAGSAPPAAAREAIHASLRRHLSEAQGREAELQRVATQLVAAALNSQLPGGARLAALATTARRAEMPFHLAMGGADPARLLALLHKHGYQRQRTDFARLPGRLAGLLTGVIDLVYLHEGRWWIVDYKTNHLGTRLADYAPDALAAAVREHDYDLQYVLYTLALHRWLRSRLGGAYDYDRDMGGAVYLFLRGLTRDGQHGVHHDRVPRALVEALDGLLEPAGGGDA